MLTPASEAYTRLWRALISLEGLSTGDAFGKGLVLLPPLQTQDAFTVRRLPGAKTGSWLYTGHTEMALSLVEQLRLKASLEEEALLTRFALHYDASRPYEPALQQLLAVRQTSLSGGQRQHLPGPGAAARVAPLGAFFAHDLEQVTQQARISAQTTHTHPEAIAGTIAVALAAALAWLARETHKRPSCAVFLENILLHTPESEVRRKLVLASQITPSTTVREASTILGNGTTSQDMVAYPLWCAGQFLDDYQEALWQTSSQADNILASCAIVGSIVALYAGLEDIPEAWLQSREDLPRWVIADVS